jgi:hypothetical protein
VRSVHTNNKQLAIVFDSDLVANESITMSQRQSVYLEAEGWPLITVVRTVPVD